MNKNDALYAAQIIYPKATKATEITKGYSHKIFEIETGAYPEKVIIKLANNTKEKFCLRKEKRIHEILQEKGIPIPRVIFLDDSKEKVSFEFMILSKLEGIDLEEIWDKLSKKEQEKLCEKFGEILGKIHTTKFDKYGYLTPTGIYDEHNFSLKKTGEKAKMNPSTLDVICQGLFDLGYLISYEDINRELMQKISEYIIENRDLASSQEKPSLIHGDFEIRNIRVKKIKGKWEICGLLDFEYAASAAREYDFIKLHRFGLLEKGHLKKGLLKGYTKYHSIPKNFKEKVKFMRIIRDISFVGVLFKSGNLELGNKVLNYIIKEIKL